jgi:hypothetical protein
MVCNASAEASIAMGCDGIGETAFAVACNAVTDLPIAMGCDGFRTCDLVGCAATHNAEAWADFEHG